VKLIPENLNVRSQPGQITLRCNKKGSHVERMCLYVKIMRENNEFVR
jgi:hypothetical protein